MLFFLRYLFWSAFLFSKGTRRNFRNLTVNQDVCIRPLMLLFLLHIEHLHKNRKSKTLCKYLFQNPNKLLALFLRKHAVLYRKVHLIFCRECNLGIFKQCIFYGTIFLQFEQDARIIYLKKFLRRILCGKTILFIYFDNHIHRRKKLLLQLMLKLQDFFLCNEMGSCQKNAQKIPPLCGGNPLYHNIVQKQCEFII